MNKKENFKTLRRRYTRQFFLHNRITFAVAAASATLSAGTNLALSWLIQQLVDAISGTESTAKLLSLTLFAAGLILSVVLIGLLSYISRPAFLKRAMVQYKSFAFQELTQKNIASFNDESTATYVSALSNDANSIEQNYLEKLFELVTDILLFIGAFCMMIFYSPLLTIAAVLLSLLPMAASFLAGNRLPVAEKTVSDKNEKFLATIKDSLSGFSVVKSFRAEKEISLLVSKSNADAEQAKCHRRKMASIIGILGASAGITTQLGVFIIGAFLALSRKGITPGVVIVFVQLMNFVIQPIAEVPQILAGRKAAMALVDKLAKAIDLHVRDQGLNVPQELHSGITIESLRFAYSPGRDVLHGITMQFNAGKSYAIVGASGSGKSTLLNLLMASHSDYTGSIQYDKNELRSISSASLYNLVSIVQQNVFVFNASIRDNITMFREFSKAVVDQAIELSGLSALIAERGEDYLCGENGCGLSGGERQRISIARCLLRKTPVLLVDEATSALDKETANHITNSILGIHGLTRIVVTHALKESLLKQYDSILTLKNGKLIETGDFQTLMDQKGYFYSLYTVSQ